MATNITYTKTFRGERAFVNELPDAAGQVLTVISKDATEDEIFAQLHDVSKQAFNNAMTWLLEGGFIKLTDPDPFPSTKTPPPEPMQVDEISIDEFTNASKIIEPTKPIKKIAVTQDNKAETKTKLDALSNAVKEAKKNTADREAGKRKAAEAAKKEQKHLEAIAAAKLAAAKKAKKTARLATETEAENLAEINAKKAEWARLKAEAEEKAKAEAKRKAAIQTQRKEKLKAEEKEKADKWLQIKSQAKLKAEEEARLQRLAKAESEVRQQREKNSKHSKGIFRKWLAKLANTIKSLFIFTAAIACLALVAAHFINIPVLKKPAEEIASTLLQDTAHIKSVHVWLFPKPHILLKELTISNSTTISAEKIRIYLDAFNLKEKFYDHLNRPYKIKSLEVESLNMAQHDSSHFRSWAKAVKHQAVYKVNNITFKNTSLKLNAMPLPLFNAAVTLDDSGLLKKVSLQTADNAFKLGAKQVNGGYIIDASAINWKVPFYPHTLLNKLNANGLIKNDYLVFDSITSSLYGGELTGALKTNLAATELSTKGKFNLTGLAISNTPDKLELSQSLSGILTSQGNFSFNIDHATNKLKNTRLNATFKVKNGMLKKIDIAEAMRTRNASGTTNFDKLTGNLSLNNKQYQLTQLSLQDNQLRATGNANISADRHLSTNISSSIAIRNNIINTNLIIEGPLNALKVKN